MDVKLVMFKADGERKDFSVTNEVTVIGRGEKCDLRVPLLSVSRRHCEVTLAEQEVKLKDLGSSNGTYVNNKRINELALKAGDRVVVGPVIFTVQVDGKPEEIQPAKVKPRAAEGGSEEGTAGQAELEAAIAAESTPASLDDIAAALEAGAGVDKPDPDPISALEALAAESKKPEDK